MKLKEAMEKAQYLSRNGNEFFVIDEYNDGNCEIATYEDLETFYYCMPNNRIIAEFYDCKLQESYAN